METKTKTIKITLNTENKKDAQILNFIEDVMNQNKKKKIGETITDSDLLKILLQIPNQKHKTQLTEMIIQELTEESKLKSLYKGYIKENDINITETDFIMHHFRKLSNREINRYIKNYIN